MVEITSETDYGMLRHYLDPLQNERLPDDVKFEIASGNRCYDIIRLYERGEEFYSKKIIEVLSQFVDMTEKCYPIIIDGVEEQYYVVNNLEACPFLNRNESISIDDPCFLEVQDTPLHIFGVENTSFVIVSEEIKNALLKKKISNILLTESFGCTKDEYNKIKKMKFKPKVRFYTEK
ncbi:MAG: hypothetical protein J5552_00385 [Prevotella sp.]|nr:hypothetical protein [Prevotella sp.]